MFPDSARQLVLKLGQREARIDPDPGLAIVVHSPAQERVLHEKRVASQLMMLLNRRVDVVFTDNRVTMISCQKRNGGIQVRLHQMFQHADDTTIGALSLYVSGTATKKTSALLDDYIRTHRCQIRVRKNDASAFPFRAEGDHVHLGEILQRVGEHYFAGDVEGVRIGWGRCRKMTQRRRRSSVRTCSLATYGFENSTIRVNPVLDSPDIPAFFLDWVIYHELLHHVLPVNREAKRVRYHHRTFRILERAFAQFEQAQAWEREHLSLLFR